MGSWAQDGPWPGLAPDAPGLCAQQPPAAPAMETFFRRHFQRKVPGPGEGQRRPGGVGLPTGKARRRSPAGQASSSLAQRRRSSGQLQGCLPVCGVGAQGTRRRRSSTAPPSCNPRFLVDEVPTAQPATGGARLLGAPLLLAGLVGMNEEEEGERVQKDMTVAALSATQPGAESPGCPPPQAARALLPVPRCLRRRRTSSHLLPADVVYDCARWGLHGYYSCLSQQRPGGQHPGPMMPARVRPLSRRRQVALRRKSAGPQAWSALLA